MGVRWEGSQFQCTLCEMWARYATGQRSHDVLIFFDLDVSAVLVTIQGRTGMQRLEVMLGEEADLSCSAVPTIPSSGLNPT